MFFEIRDQLTEIDRDRIDPEVLTVGCVSGGELPELAGRFEFDEDTVAASSRVRPLFHTGVDVHEKYTFAVLKVINRDGHEDSVSLYIMRNLILIVDIVDEDGSTIKCFFDAVRKYPCARTNGEKIISRFVESLLAGGSGTAEEIHSELAEMEESIVREDPGDSFNVDLLELKKRIRRYYYYYGQILDFAETVAENENDVLNEDNLIYISNLTGRVTRLRDEMNMLVNYADHIQDAYATLLDQRMNSTMKVLTILTTVFFPLTIIVGWYGMNFQHMPEFAWKYGYVYVIVLSVAVVALLTLIGKKKKWF